MALKFIDHPEFNVTDKKVLIRFDFNVPLDKNDHSLISDTTRIDAALPTLRYILERKPSKVILLSHLGRPKGKRDIKLTLEPVAKYLARELREEVLLTETATDSGIKTLLNLNSSKIIFLENLRFHPEEKSNYQNFLQNFSQLR